jgi:hypothetical protein
MLCSGKLGILKSRNLLPATDLNAYYEPLIPVIVQLFVISEFWNTVSCIRWNSRTLELRSGGVPAY